MRHSTGRWHDNDSGFTLVEVVIAVALLGVVTSVLAVSFQTMFRTHEETSQRYVESLDAQTASAFLANDVQSMIELGGNCGSGGTAVVSFQLGGGDVVTYRHDAAEGALVREACGSDPRSTDVARWLDPSLPVVAVCDGGACTAGRPRRVEIPLTSHNQTVNGTPQAIDSTPLSYTLTGARRTHNSDNSSTEPPPPPSEAAPFIALSSSAGGVGVLEFHGTAELKVHGSLVVDSDQPGAVEINANSDIIATRFFIRRDGTCIGCEPGNSSPMPVPYDELLAIPHTTLTPPSGVGLPVDPPPVGPFFVPGRYTSTIHLDNNPHRPKSFLPGEYILEDGLSVSGTPSVSGSGVLFYNEGGTFDLSGATATFSGHSGYEGLLLWQPASNGSAIPVNGASTDLTIDGGIFAPGSVEGYALSTGSPISRLRSVIATNMTLGGGGTVCVGEVTRPCP